MRKPKLIISKCLNSEKCRYDGQGYNDKVIMSLKNHAEIENVCPEVSIGLSIPRDALRIEKHKENEEYKLIQHNTNYDFTDKMTNFASDYISSIDDVDGFILKGRSPSCGIKDVKIYHQGNKCSLNSDGTGLFSQKILEKYNYLPIESEGRLKNYSIRDSFFTKIFTINRLKSCKNIYEFHNNNEVLLKSYNEEKFMELNKMLSKYSLSKEQVNNYKLGIYEILSSNRNKDTKLAIINEMFDKYKNQLNNEEVDIFNNLVKSYKNEKVPFSSLALVIRMYATRFNDSKILQQSFFNPYPDDLIDISDSGKGRDL